MKMNKIKSLIFVLAAGLFMNSCSEGITELNVDPDRSPTANPAQVLTAAPGALGLVQESEYNHDSFLWAQYWCWGPGVAIANQGKSWRPPRCWRKIRPRPTPISTLK